MEEKILQGKKNGMLVLVITTLLYIAAGIGLVFGILADKAWEGEKRRKQNTCPLRTKRRDKRRCCEKPKNKGCRRKIWKRRVELRQKTG